MASRFNTSKYDPTVDSSPGSDTYRPGPDSDRGENDEALGFTGVILDLTPLSAPHDHLDPCECGCRLPLQGKGRRFRPGHDAKLRGILIRAYVTGTEVTWLDGGSAVSGDAVSYAQRFTTGRQDWPAMLRTAKALHTADRPARPARAPKAQQLDDWTNGTVKVGRWEYPASRNADGEVSRNTKRDGSGATIAVTAGSKDAATFTPAV
jgi:hypothetical protein